MNGVLLRHLARNNGFIARLLTGVGTLEAVTLHGRCNSIAWIAGHLAHNRAGLLRLVGVDDPAEAWEAQVRRGGAKIADPGADLATLQAVFVRRGARFAETLPTVAPARLAEPCGTRLPDGGTTVAAAIEFLLFHETFHLGQLDLLRVALGLPGIP